MLCPNCNSEVMPNSKFCMSCGSKIVTDAKCQSCGEKLPSGAKFCLNCGQKVTAGGENSNNYKESYNLYGYSISIPSDDVKIYKLADQLSYFTHGIILKKYEEAGNLERLVKSFPSIITEGYTACADKLLAVITQATKQYDLTAKDILNVSNSSSAINSLKNYLESHYLELVEEKENAKMHREYRKDSRSRLVGGGLSLKGAAKGMAAAGAFNMLTGAAHSMYNAVDGAFTNDKIASQMHNVFLGGKENLLDIIKLDMTTIVLGVASRSLGLQVRDYSLTEENAKKAIAILDAVEAGRVPDGDIKEQVAKAIECNVCNTNSYIKAFEILGDDNKELAALAQKLSLQEVIDYITAREIEDKKQSFEQKFNQIDKTNRNEIIAYKKALVEAGLYSDDYELSKKLDDLIYNSEVVVIKSMVENYDPRQAEIDSKTIVAQGFNKEIIAEYYDWMLRNDYAENIDRNDRQAVFDFKKKLENCKYVSTDSKVMKLVNGALQANNLSAQWDDVDKTDIVAVEKFYEMIQTVKTEAYDNDIVVLLCKSGEVLSVLKAERAMLEAFNDIDLDNNYDVDSFIELYGRKCNNSIKFKGCLKVIENHRQKKSQGRNSSANTVISNNSSGSSNSKAQEGSSISDFGEIFNKYVNYVNKDGGGSFYSFAKKDMDKLKSFCEACQKKLNRSPEIGKIVAYYDGTMFGGGDEGVGVALDGVYYLSDKEKVYEFISYNDMGRKAEYDSGMFSNKIMVFDGQKKIKMDLYADGTSEIRREMVNVINLILEKR